MGLISMDQYFLTQSQREAEQINFDHPSHLDIELLVKHLEAIRRGNPILIPSYDFRTMIQTPDATLLRDYKVVLVEGLFVLSSPIVDLMDFTCFLEVEKDQLLLGRLLRDLRERSSTMERTIDRYQRYVRPSYDVFVGPTKHNAEIVLDFTFRRAYFTQLLAQMVSDIVAKGLDIDAFITAVKGDTYRLGYSIDKPVMPTTIDIRDLARVYPEHVLHREPVLAGDISEVIPPTSNTPLGTINA